jgi:transposase
MFEEAKLDFIAKNPDLARTVVQGLSKEVLRLRQLLAGIKGVDQDQPLIEMVGEYLEETSREEEIERKRQFARSSEKRRADKQAGDEDSKRTKPQGSGKQALQADLPLVIEERELTQPEDLQCGCGQTLAPMNQQEVSEEIDYIPAKIIRRRILRQKYRCTCGVIRTAPCATKLVDGGQYSIGFGSEISARKYSDYQPLQRIAKALKRDGLNIRPSTLWNQTRHMANALELVHDAIRAEIQKGYLRHADETRWRILEEVSTKTQFAWLFCTTQLAYLTIEETRSGAVPRKILGACQGVLVADDYGGYNGIVNDNDLTRIQCWSHARRKFVDLEELYPEKIGKVLDLIGLLYQKDREFRFDGALTATRRRALCGPVIKEIDNWRKAQAVLPRSAFGKALNYLHHCWEGLTGFLDDPAVPLDNNLSERILRGVVLGRKNFLFNRSVQGAWVSSILFSVCATCDLNGVNPKAYMEETVTQIRNGQKFLLPHDYAQKVQNQ